MRSICYRRQGSRSETLFLVLSKVHKVTPCFMYMIAHDIVHHSSDCDTNELDEPSRSVRNTNANTNTNTHTIIILILLLILALRRITMGGAGVGGGRQRRHSVPRGTTVRHQRAPHSATVRQVRHSAPKYATVRRSAPKCAQCAKVRHSAPSAPQCATVRQNAFAASPPKPPVPKKRNKPRLAASRRHPRSRGVAAPPAISRRRGVAASRGASASRSVAASRRQSNLEPTCPIPRDARSTFSFAVFCFQFSDVVIFVRLI